MRRSHETGKHGDDTPCDQYSRNPDACSDAVKKKIPAMNPYCWLVIASSLFIVRAANPMLFRSRAAMMNRTKTNGMMCVRSLRIIVTSIVLGARAGLVVTSHPRDGFGTV